MHIFVLQLISLQGGFDMYGGKMMGRMQKKGPNGDGKSAVATIDGRSRKKKKRSSNFNECQA